MESQNHIALSTLVIIGTLAILVLVFFIILFVQLYQKRMLAHKVLIQNRESEFQHMLLKTSAEIAELERKKIASNLHDDVGVMLSVLKLKGQDKLRV